MKVTPQSLAWAGIGLVTLGMALAFVAVVADRRGDPSHETARVQVISPDDGPVMSLPTTDDPDSPGSVTSADPWTTQPRM